MNGLMDFFSANYYTALLITLVAIPTIVIIVKHKRKCTILEFTPEYLGLFLLQSFLNVVILKERAKLQDPLLWYYSYTISVLREKEHHTIYLNLQNPSDELVK